MSPANAKAGGAPAKSRRRRQRKTRTLAVSDEDSDSSLSSSSSSSQDSESEDAIQDQLGKIVIRRRSLSVSSSSSSSASSTASSTAFSSSVRSKAGSISSDSSSSSDTDSDDSNSDTVSKTKRSARRHITAVVDTQDHAIPSSSGKRKNIFRLTPEPHHDSLDDTPAKKSSSHKQLILKALEPDTSHLPPHLQRIVDAKSSSSSSAVKAAANGARRSTPQQTQAQRERRRQAFRSLWLKAVADEFGDELDTIRTREPTLGADGGIRLPLFIDALASGSELFSSPSYQRQPPGHTMDAGQDTLDEVSLASNLP